MDDAGEDGIVKAEERLSQAMLASDLEALDRLLRDDLLFTNHLGGVMGKAEDMAAHRTGVLRVLSIDASEQHIQMLGEAAVVSVRVALQGTYAGHAANGDFRFTRVWQRSTFGNWQVAAVHSGLISQ